ncbi:MAG: hypothetical protein KAQ98_07960 [Bacteriovoracaceae bacterium]|nr:hypothetical protein [Bacteriovoracaceae bacterium]
MEGEKGFFIKSNVREVLVRLAGYASHGGIVTIWDDISELFSLKLVNFECKHQLMLMCKFEDKNKKLDLLNVHVHMKIKNVNFFSSGILTQKENDEYVIQKLENVYRFEKRKNDRLLSFPHRKIYIYFNMVAENDDGNVISLNRLTGNKDEVFEEFAKVVYGDKFIGNDGTPMTGFRILDISEDGASFLANDREKDYFTGNSSFSNIRLDFNGRIFSFASVKVKNVVDYIDPRSINVPMYKVGVTFGGQEKKFKEFLAEYFELIEAPGKEDLSYRSFLKLHDEI